jgi:hypothetical protein
VNKFLTCRLFLCKLSYVFKRKLLSYSVEYFKCSYSRYLQIDEPFWLEQAYKEGVNLTDKWLTSRSIHNLGVVL